MQRALRTAAANDDENNMTTHLITAPATEPVTLDEMKLHLRQDASVGVLEDAYISRMIKAARQRAQHLTQRAFITQTWGVKLDQFPDAIELLPSPVVSVTSVKYLDVNNVEQTLAPADYVLDNFGLMGYIVPAYGKTWPDTYPEINAVRVEFIAGYGNAAAVPECVKDYIFLIVEDAYRNRGATVDNKDIRAHPFLDRILDPISLVLAG
ncbi:MAG: phage head-tail connector protein [Rhodocyclaceae bacterium]|nr:phage head-tail connector protein [Rhodocyclaceae bacterium]